MVRLRGNAWAYLALGLLLEPSPCRGGSLEPVDFQRDVRPILSDNCFRCHGPDPNTRMAGLRLDTREGAFARRDNGTAVVPGDLESSLLYKRITLEDAM